MACLSVGRHCADHIIQDLPVLVPFLRRHLVIVLRPIDQHRLLSVLEQAAAQISAVVQHRRLDLHNSSIFYPARHTAKVRMYLVYLEYWTPNLMPLMVYRELLFHPNLSIKVPMRDIGTSESNNLG